MAKDQGLPGIRTDRVAGPPRKVLKTDTGAMYLARGRTIDGSKSRDPLNTGDLDVLRAGMLMGMISASKKFAPSIIGVIPSAHETTGSTVLAMTLGVANAVEIVRRIGASGTFKITGPPSAAGVVATTTVTYSAIDVATGIATITDIATSHIAGSFLQPNDGSETPLGILLSDYGLKVTNKDATSQDTQMPLLLVGGVIDSSQILNWPSDTSLITQVKTWLRAKGYGFLFDDDFL